MTKPKKKKAAFPPPVPPESTGSNVAPDPATDFPVLREPVQSVLGGVSQVRTVKIEPEDPDALPSRTNQWLRQLAETVYVTSPTPITILSLSRDPKFKDKAKLDALKYWSKRDHWVDKRVEYFSRIQSLLKEKIGTALVKAQFDQLEDMDRLSQDMYNKLDAAEVKSYEGLVRALVTVEEFRKNERIRLAQAMVPDKLGGDSRQPGTVVPQLSMAEAKRAAHAILKARHEETKAKIAADADDDTSDEGTE